MITFLKVLLIVLLIALAAKLLPLALALVAVAGLMVGLVLLVGFGAAALVAGLVLLAALVLSPLWLPVLALVGIIALCRHAFASKTAGGA